MTNRNRLVDEIASTISDYRMGDIRPLSTAHVDRWIGQFPHSLQEPILAELGYVLKRTYFSRAATEKAFAEAIRDVRLIGSDPSTFWKSVEFLDVQRGGRSQRALTALFDSVLRREVDISIHDRTGVPEAYVYLDDGVFTGNRIKTDLRVWIRAAAPLRSVVHVVTLVRHRAGSRYAEATLLQEARDAGKQLELNWWSALEIEDRDEFIDDTDVLRPVLLPNDELVERYVSGLQYGSPVLRTPGGLGSNRFFSCEAGRHLLEQIFLLVGVRLRNALPSLPIRQRPLGNMILHTLGCGSMIVTFQNCPNSCPLALWMGSRWYPHFPRRTN